MVETSQTRNTNSILARNAVAPSMARRVLGDVKNFVRGAYNGKKDNANGAVAAGQTSSSTSSRHGLQPQQGVSAPSGTSLTIRTRRNSASERASEPGGGNIPLRSSRASSLPNSPNSRTHSAGVSDANSDLPDIDSKDARDPLAAPEYAVDIFNFYLRVESRYVPCSSYMERQVEITPWMRSVLVDWLVEVHLKFKLMPETLHLSVNIIDRYLSARGVRRRELQLLGVAAMFLACKYEEIYPPEVRDFVQICDRAYSRQQILLMERRAVELIEFKITVPTTFHFLVRFAKAAGQEGREFLMLCSYLAELALVDYRMLEYPYSKVAAACVHISLAVNRAEDLWPEACRRHSGYTRGQLLPVARLLRDLMERAKNPRNDVPAVYRKYREVRYYEVARVPIPDIEGA